MFALIASPILRSIDSVKVSSFIGERERYELELQCKAAEGPMVNVGPYIVSSDRSLLQQLFFIRRLPKFAREAIIKTVTSKTLGLHLLPGEHQAERQHGENREDVGTATLAVGNRR